MLEIPIFKASIIPFYRTTETYCRIKPSSKGLVMKLSYISSDFKITLWLWKMYSKLWAMAGIKVGFSLRFNANNRLVLIIFFGFWVCVV